jgi:hypothetical protein
LISVTIQDLQQNPQDTSNFYLANTYQATINPNVSSSLPTAPPPFTPPNYAVWVNALWFLSLVISLTCALLATFLQQWARRYLKFTQSRYSPHKRARIRAFFAEGVEKCLLPRAVETLPTLLHISLFLFFAGLVVFLWNVNLTIFKLVLSWVAICTALYGCFTLMPIFRHDSPYYTSLSSSAWPIVYGSALFVLQPCGMLLYLSCWRRGGKWMIDLARRCFVSLSRGMQKAVEKTALSSPPEIDTRAFMWTFDCLDEDHELERFFSGLPGLRSSKVVDDPLPSLTKGQKSKLSHTLTGLMDRTFSSDLLHASVKEGRALICAKALDPVHFPNAFGVLDMILSKCHYSGPMVPRIVQVMRGWGDNMKDISVAQATVCSIVAQAQRRDHSWFILASDALGSPEAVLRDHATHGNSLSLAILIYVVRQQFNHFKEQHWPYYEFSKVLEAASKFDVLDTSPELQHEFCALWNELIQNRANTWCLLRPIRNIYLTIHLHTDSAPTAFSASTRDEDPILRPSSSYPQCDIPGHHPDLTPQIHNATTPTAIAHAFLRDDAQLTSTPDAPTPSVPAPLHVYNDPSAETIAPSTRETSTLTSSVLLPAAVSPHNYTELLVHSDAPEIMSSDPPESVLDGITGPSPLTTHLLSPESHCARLVTISPGTSPRPASAPGLDIIKGSTEAGSCGDEDAIDPASEICIIQANATVILDVPSHTSGPPLLPPPAPDIVAVGSSQPM